MAYPTVSAPYGLVPVNRIDGLPYAGQTRQIPIAVGYATAIFNGDTVKLDSTGFLVADTGTNNATPVGVLVGCQYVNSSGQKIQGQFYPAAASTTANNAIAYVIDDPMAAFKVAVVSTGTTMATVGRTVVGSNMELVQNTGSTTTGDSAVAVLSTSTSTTNTLPVRVIDVVPETATGANAFAEVIVKINTHQYNSTTGV
ncbi:MAG: hypothetical protein RL156_1716 [Bacteroidota bacterium]|jgi:hypothetical protein